MKICNETKTLNFLLACFKSLRSLVKAVFEFDIRLSGGETIKPDLLCYIIYNQIPFYSLFEFKKKKLSSQLEGQELERVRKQYHNYQSFNVSDLEGLFIPKDLESKIYINYLFLNTHQIKIEEFINLIPIQDDIDIYSLLINRRNLIKVQSSNQTLNSKMMEEFIQLSNDEDNWNKVYIPFTFNDIVDIHGDRNNTRINRNAGCILTNSLMQFIIARKIIGKPNRFRIDEFIDFIFKNNYRNFNIGREENESLKKNMRLFLHFISEELPDKINITPLLERINQSEYRIKIKKTNTLVKRAEEIKIQVVNYFIQTRITDFKFN